MRSSARTAALASAALIGFAANSLLCRAALAERSIDAASFTFARLASGALVLAVLVRADSSSRVREGNWISAAALFGYAITFSFAYLRLSAGAGALVLFGCVQTTMIGTGVARGERPTRAEWCGLVIAFVGLAVLTWRGATALDPIGLLLMATAGACWGIYSLRGRASRSALAATAGNFVRCVPFAAAALALAITSNGWHVSRGGLVFAIASGALASGIGYSFWYAALPRLSSTRAAILQLLVPILTAFAGVLLLGERVSPRLVGSATLILGGVGLALVVKGRWRGAKSSST